MGFMPDMPKIRRVVIVDDERLIASTMKMILCRHGLDVESFTDPREALRASKFRAPDLLISDFMMPLLSGIELANQVQETCPKCKVLLISGRAFDQEFLDALSKNGRPFEVLSKPVDPSVLL
jgi:CheY-like chemotaxis protein